MPQSSSGFTLIELIAIMVIASILGTGVISTYSNYNKWLDVNEEVLDMVNTLRRARDYCIAANENFYLSVSTGADTYTLKYKASKDALKLPGASSNVFSLPDNADLTASSVGTDLEFNILGEPTGGATITINNGGRSIIIVAPTGYIYAQ